MGARGVLLLTVGTGTADELEATLVGPTKKSLEKGEWAKVVLLPSKGTENKAIRLRERFPEYQIEVSTLPKDGDEQDADACFVHFDGQIRRLLEEGFHPEAITADITRGTRPMSAGLMMAAAAHGVGRIRYITASRRDEAGTAVPGTETPKDIEIERIFRRRNVSLALELLRHGDFGAIQTLFPGAPRLRRPGYLEHEISWLAWAAAFWGAWDRFDYQEAARLAKCEGMPAEVPSLVAPWLPSGEQKELLSELAGPAPPRGSDNAGYCRALAADLIANARRRLREGRHEEVLVRVYRILELLGQLRLFTHGVDTDSVNPKDARLAPWFEKNPHRRQRNGRIQLGRQEAAELLEWLEKQRGDQSGLEIARKLKNLNWLGELAPSLRNRSVLIHGFLASTRGRQKQELSQLLDKVTRLYLQEHPRNSRWLQAARFPPEVSQGEAAHGEAQTHNSAARAGALA